MPLTILNNHDVCGRCTEHCCYRKESSKLRGPLSYADVRRIVEATGLLSDEFVEFAPRPEENDLQLLRKNLPTLAPLFESQSEYMHLKFPDGACVLLKDGRCRLDLQTRPRFCSLYPLWFDLEDGEFEVHAGVVSAGRRCLAVKESGGDAGEILEMFGMTVQDLQDLVKATRREIDEYGEAGTR